MKKILLGLFILIGVEAFSQQPTGQWPFMKPQNVRGVRYNGLQAEQEFYFPRKDTLWTPAQPGAKVYWEQPGDTAYWYCRKLTGKKWYKDGDVSGDLALKLNISDTASMLANYITAGEDTHLGNTDLTSTANRTFAGAGYSLTFSGISKYSVIFSDSLMLTGLARATNNRHKILSIDTLTKRVYYTDNGNMDSTSTIAPSVVQVIDPITPITQVLGRDTATGRPRIIPIPLILRYALRGITLTTIGTSGASTWDSETGVFNIPNYTSTAYTFSTGLTNTANTITGNLSTGISGGQSVIGGTGGAERLTLSSTTNASKGQIRFGNSTYDESGNQLSLGSYTIPPEAAVFVTRANSSGTNVDIRANTTGAGANTATVEVQSSDFETSFKSAYLQFTGSGIAGTTMGVTNVDMGKLIFQENANALIGAYGNTPIIIGINNSEQARFHDSGFTLIDTMRLQTSPATATSNYGLLVRDITSGKVKQIASSSFVATRDRFGYTGEDATAAENRSFATGSAYTVTVTGSKTSDGVLRGINTATGTGIYGTSVGGVGVNGASTIDGGIGVLGNANTGSSAIGVYGTASTGIGVRGLANDGGKGGEFQTLSSTTNSVVSVLNVHRTSSGTAANGLGGSIDFTNQTTGNSYVGNQLISKWTDATEASRTSQFELYGVNSGTLARKLAIAGNGETTLDVYGSGTVTGTPTYLLAVNSSGKLIETAFSGNYINNSTTQQASSNFNISGTGVIGTGMRVGGSAVTSYTAEINGSLSVYNPSVSSYAVQTVFGGNAAGSIHANKLDFYAFGTSYSGVGAYSPNYITIATGSQNAKLALVSFGSFGYYTGGTATFNERWRIESTGHYITPTDNTYDIGASGATRPRNLYLGTALTVGTTATIGTTLTLTTTPTTSAGSYDLLSRNSSTGVVEKIGSSTFVTTRDRFGFLSEDVSASASRNFALGANTFNYTGSANMLNLTSTSTSASAIYVSLSNAGSTGITVDGSGNQGGNFTGAVAGVSGNSNAIPVWAVNNSTSLSGVVNGITINRAPTGTAEAGIGSDIITNLTNSSSATVQASKIVTSFTSPTASSEIGKWDLILRGNNTNVSRFNILGNTGEVTMSGYGTGAIFGTAVTGLAVTSAGRIVETGLPLLTANNGLNYIGTTNVKLGGTLIENTLISEAGYNMSFEGTGGTFTTAQESGTLRTNLTVTTSSGTLQTNNTSSGKGYFQTSAGGTIMRANSPVTGGTERYSYITQDIFGGDSGDDSAIVTIQSGRLVSGVEKDVHNIYVKSGRIELDGTINGSTLLALYFMSLPVYANDAAASSLSANRVYKTSTGELRIKL